MKDALLCLFAVACMVCGLVLMILASATGQQKRVGPWLVRGKLWLVGILEGET
jgi:hypothetical protein